MDKKIIKIRIAGYLGAEIVSFNNLGRLNYITGPNGAGKTSVMKGIKEGFVSSGVDPTLINNECEKAEIMIELNENILIERKITPSTNRVEVTIDDQPVQNPQAYLKSLLGKNGFNFNPLDFFFSKDKERNNIVLSAIHFTLNADKIASVLTDSDINVDELKFDLSKYDYTLHGLFLLEKIKKDVYEYRQKQGHEVDQLKKSLAQDFQDMPDTVDISRFTDFDLDKKLDEQVAEQKTIDAHNANLSSLQYLRNQREEVEANIESGKKAIEEAKAYIEGCKQSLAQIMEKGTALKEITDAFKSPDMEQIKTDISDFNKHQRWILKKEEMDTRTATLEKAKIKKIKLDEFCKQIVGDIPRLILSEVDLPVKGLEFKDGDIFVNSVQIDKLSDSERMIFGVNLSRELSGELKIVCIDGWEMADPKTRKLFEETTEGDGFEYFITEVDRSGEGGDGLKLEVKDAVDKEPPSKPVKKTATKKKPVAKKKSKKRTDF